MMAPSSITLPAYARNFEADALRRVAELQYDALAVALGCDKSTVSRMFGDRGMKLVEIPIVLKSLGWKIVSHDKVCIDRSVHEAYRTIAAAALADPKKLEWDAGE